MRVAPATLVVGLLAAPLGAQPFELRWWTVDGGGAMNGLGGPYRLDATIGQPDAGGPFAGAPFTLVGGFWAQAAGVVVAEADLALALADAPDPVAAGGALTYQVQITSKGPSVSPGMTLTLTLPSAVTFVSSNPGPPTCGQAGGVVTCALGSLAPAASATVVVQVAVAASASGTLASHAVVVGHAPDPVAANNADDEGTTVLVERPEAELGHGTRLLADLAGASGAPDVDLFRLHQSPYASYEVVLDTASGDVGTGSGPGLDRVAADGSTVLQPSVPVGTGSGRSLRFANATSTGVSNQLIRVRSLQCGSDCGADDVYRLRAWDTTLTVPRFNNSGSQVTVVILQNPTAEPVSATLYFWATDGTLLATHAAGPLPPKGLLVLSTAGIPGLAGASGSVTAIHDAPYGVLAGKTVALEPSTGFSFDSPMLPRPR